MARVPRWMHDEEADGCVNCNAPFDILCGRHHCRACGMIFCDDCSSFRCLVHPAEAVYPPDWDSLLSSFDPREPLRTCQRCHEFLRPQQAELRRTTSNAAQPTEVDREGVERYLNVPIQFDMRAEILKATHTLYNFCDDNAIEGEDSVPRELIASAWGLAFVTTMQAGFFFSARVGSGLVIARTPDGGWSAPSAVCIAGGGWGLQIGGEVTDMLIVLNSQDAVDAFTSTAQLSLGTELSLALGPMGRSAETNMTAGDGGVSAVFSYAHSKGFFVGIALQACVILARPDCNESFYGEKFDAEYVLSGALDRPLAAEPLYKALHEVCHGFEPAPHYHEHEPRYKSMYKQQQQQQRPPTSLDPVRAYPVRSEQTQSQMDADMAMALALAEEDQLPQSFAQPRVSAHARGPSPPVVQSSTSWFGGSSSSAAPDEPRDDDWEVERSIRLATIENLSVPVEELRHVSQRTAFYPFVVKAFPKETQSAIHPQVKLDSWRRPRPEERSEYAKDDLDEITEI